MSLAHFTALLLVAGVWGGESEVKKWIPDTRFDNPDNWDLKRAPCERDRVVFPSSLDIGIALPSGTTVLSELVLPMTGEVLLPTNGALKIAGSGRSTSNCVGRDIVFTRTKMAAWLDPFNWQGAATQQPSPVPHVDRIPCEHDIVQFRAESSFRVQLPTIDVSVGGIRFGDNAMSDEDWVMYLTSDTGYREFVGPPETRASSVTIRPPPSCLDKSGCVCNSVSPQRLLRAVCRHVTPRCDAILSCYEPITPHGHCCAVCGAVLQLKVDKAFDVRHLKELIEERVREEKYANVRFYARKTVYDQGKVQVVLVESGGYRGNSNQLAAILADDVIKDMDLGVTKVTTSTSGPVYLGSKMAAAAKTFFGTLLAVVTCLGLVFYVFIVYRQGLPLGLVKEELFQFARFRNDSRSEEVAIAISDTKPLHVDTKPLHVDTKEDTKEDTRQAFDNPMYGTAAILTVGPTNVNPLYSELVRREGEGGEEEGGDSDDETDQAQVFDEVLINTDD